ncbi:Glycosyl_transferase family 2 protein [Hexamita inflata]|uniref:Glycosyl transferase family 2 protein n=1 Tax=Hexamita inflata TaxID=28002 RepID=A0AA86QPU5_9EUKA|nr:Glycosyl transferase family 2 protein [Hexamita inflata]
MQPQVSIVTPAYNAAYCIENALKYALAQTYAHWDMIVVNDGSTDNTAEIVQSYADKHPNIKLHTLPRNRGVFYARNFGVTLASEFVVFLDADDELTPTAIEEAVLTQQKFNVDMVHCSCIVLHEPTNTRQNGRNMGVLYPNVLKNEQIIEAYAQNSCMLYMLWGKLFRKSVLEHAIKKMNIIAANRIVYAEDILFQAAMLTQNMSIIGSSSIMYVYHLNPLSLTNQKLNEQKNFEKNFMLHFTKKCTTVFAEEIKRKTNVQLDFYRPSEHHFKVTELCCSQDIRNQIILLQIWNGVGMFNSGPEHNQLIKQMWEETVFNKCTIDSENNLHLNNNEIIKHSEILTNKQVEIWNGQNSEEIFCKGLSLKQTFELIDHIWEQRESGVDVQKETENSYGGWYNNYLKATGGI